MSAFVVSSDHIQYLVDAACAYSSAQSGAFTWYWQNRCWCLREFDVSDQEELLKPGQSPTTLGQMLWDANLQGVQAAMAHTKECQVEDLKFAALCVEQWKLLTFKHTIGGSQVPLSSVQVLKAIGCLDYQCCDHDGWEQSQAHAVLQGLKAEAISRIPGYKVAHWAIAPRAKRRNNDQI